MILICLKLHVQPYFVIKLWGQKKFKRENIEVRNKSSLVELLSSFLPEREAEGHFLEERQYIVNYIKQL